ncbi:hypothetical protein [Streptomyces herbicida]|uniref:hypothetical protein n=1 Tax=Streptomyces herbicida TaxID=3065675 RepID=UPI0029311C3A|nr:hypothetical protein [Streptomyces sp. NEAU-HV9]
MTHTLTAIDQLRIEYAVWRLDSLLYDLGWRSRVAKRREVRANLHAAAADVGTTEALRQLGGVRRLAAEYLAAEYGDWGRRPTWTTGAVCMLVVQFGSYALIEAGRSAFTAGVLAAHPHPQGTYHWAGIPYLSADATVTFTGTGHSSLGGAYTPLVYLGMLAAFVVGARLWRLLPPGRRHQATTSTAEPAEGSR